MPMRSLLNVDEHWYSISLIEHLIEWNDVYLWKIDFYKIVDWPGEKRVECEIFYSLRLISWNRKWEKNRTTKEENGSPDDQSIFVSTFCFSKSFSSFVNHLFYKIYRRKYCRNAIFPSKDRSPIEEANKQRKKENENVSSLIGHSIIQFQSNYMFFRQNKKKEEDEKRNSSKWHVINSKESGLFPQSISFFSRLVIKQVVA